MKKSVLNLGKALQKQEQREITGGYGQSNLSAYCGSLYIAYFHNLDNGNTAAANNALAAWNQYCPGVN